MHVRQALSRMLTTLIFASFLRVLTSPFSGCPTGWGHVGSPFGTGCINPSFNCPEGWRITKQCNSKGDLNGLYCHPSGFCAASCPPGFILNAPSAGYCLVPEGGRCPTGWPLIFEGGAEKGCRNPTPDCPEGWNITNNCA